MLNLYLNPFTHSEPDKTIKPHFLFSSNRAENHDCGSWDFEDSIKNQQDAFIELWLERVDDFSARTQRT